ncbi:right-handed parallel beta-helix repeat-containing protein [Limibacter armeniacum]|uniref:right-handed parallel beta-helix repeat-containing protein n=1 Tax=Limibacter armeniacum TaxID=466084 RepID=UPI002FE56B0C
MKFSNWIAKTFLISTFCSAVMMSCDSDSDNDIINDDTSVIEGKYIPADSTDLVSTDQMADSVLTDEAVDLAEDEVLVNGEAVKVDFWIEPEMVYLKASDHPELNKPGLVMAFRPSESPRGRLVMNGWKGTRDEPITILNKDQVLVASSEQGKHALWFTECEYIRVRGDGNPLYEYGIHIVESGSSGMSFDQNTTGIEVAYTEIENTSFAGILAKTDNASGWVMRDVHLHHNHIHNTHGEGMYIGQTSVDNAHKIENLYVNHNLIHDTGWDLFQIANVHGDVHIFNNTFVNGGLEEEPMQDQGFQIGDWSQADCYNNIISNTNSRFLFVKGGHDTNIYNNYFSSTKQADAIFIKTEKKLDPSAELKIHDNWFRDYNRELFWSMVGDHEVIIEGNKYSPNNDDSDFIVYSGPASEENHTVTNNEQMSLPAIELDEDYNIKSGSYYDGYDLGYMANESHDKRMY